MRRTQLLLLMAVLITAFTSCQKEVSFDDRDPDNPGGGTTTDAGTIIGEYDFVGMTASTVSTGIFTESGQTIKNVTTSYYITKNNTGTLKFTATDLSTTNIAYDIDTTAKVVTYINGILLDEMEAPIAISMPATSNTAAYVRNTTDSITVTGTFVAPPGGMGLPMGPAPSSVGFRIGWSGDTLLLKTIVHVGPTTIPGIPGTVVSSANSTMKLKKRP